MGTMMILFYRQGNESQRDFKNTLQTQSVSSRALVLTQLIDGNLSRDKARIRSCQDKFILVNLQAQASPRNDYIHCHDSVLPVAVM